MNTVNLYLPVPLYLEVFYKNFYGQDAFVLRTKDPLGCIAKRFLGTKPAKRTSVKQGLDGRLQFVIPRLSTRQVYTTGIFWSQGAEDALQETLYRKFKHIFYDFMTAARVSESIENKSRKIKFWIETFQETYGLTEDLISYDMLKKSFFRYRKQRERYTRKNAEVRVK